MGDEGPKPQGLLRSVRSSNVLALGSRKRNQLLSFCTPRDGTAVDNEHIAGYGLPFLTHATICIRIAQQFLGFTAIPQPKLPSAFKIPEYSLYCLPVAQSWLAVESGNTLHGKANIWTRSKRGVHERTDGFVIWDVPHSSKLLCGRW